MIQVVLVAGFHLFRKTYICSHSAHCSSARSILTLPQDSLIIGQSLKYEQAGLKQILSIQHSDLYGRNQAKVRTTVLMGCARNVPE